MPLYESCCGGKGCKSKTPAPSILEPYVREAREECEGFINPIVGDYPQKIRQELQSSVKLVKGMLLLPITLFYRIIKMYFRLESIEYLQDDKNQAARAAYITAVGFLGFIIARRGIIKRTTYALIGAGAAAALCNPPLAKDYAEISYSLATKKVTELYNQYGGLC